MYAGPRPLTKKVLKNMFLKVLWEHQRPGGRYSDTSPSVQGIVRYTLPQHFQLRNDNKNLRLEWALTEQELDDALQGVEELQTAGFLRNDPKQRSPEFKLLTDKAIKFVETDLEKMVLPSVNIEEVLSRDDLQNKVRDDYMAGDFDSAIAKAFQMVEEAVRAKSKQPAGRVGHDLMAAAFGGKTPVLKHPDAQTTSEEQALFFLFGGGNGWFRNPTHHRTVGYSDPHEVAQILGLANLLLDMVDKCH